METAKITFSNGEEIIAEVNGDSFIIDEEPTFPDNLENITIEKDGQTSEIEHGRIIECASVDGRYWFAIGQISAEEMAAIKIRSDIDYIAAMTDVDLDS